MKKLLALVLAMVMTLGLATVSSSAAFSDEADVSLNEAVDVMSAVGVFQGADGKFSPKANLNREQAAKLIAYLDLGEDTAEALPAVKVFDDVPATSWSAKYIAYCADAGYIAGDGTGKFNPTGELNGYAFGKMILCVLGYDADIEGFVGNNWSIAVAKLMESNDIADGVSGAASATLTREQAAQYCLNALKADMVEYDTKGTSIDINGAKIATGASKAEAVTDSTNVAKHNVIGVENYDVLNNNQPVNNGAKTVVQLGEKLYDGKLELNEDAADAFGRPSTKWEYKDKAVGTYTDDAAVTFTASTKAAAVADALSGYKTASGVKINNTDKYVAEGQEANEIAKLYNADAEYVTTNGTITLAAAIANLTDNGTLVELYASSKKLTKVVVIEYTNNKVTKVSTNKSGDTTYTFATATTTNVTTGVDYADNSNKNDTIVFVTAPAKDDYVTTAYADGKTYVYPTTKVEGAITYAKANSELTIGGTTYKANAPYDAGNDNNFALTAVDKVATVYLDQYGYVSAYKGPSESGDKSIIVTDRYTTLDDGKLVPMVKGITSDGNETTMKVEGNNVNDITVASVYTYADQDDDDYKELTAVVYTSGTVNNGDIDNDKVVYVGKAALAATVKKVMVKDANPDVYGYFTSDVKVIFVNGDGKSSVATGTQKVAADSEQFAVLKKSDDDATYYIDTLYVSGTPVASSTTSDEIIFVASNSGSTVGKVVDGKNKTFYNYKAYLNGEKIDGFYATTNVETSNVKGFYSVDVQDNSGAYVLTGNAYTRTNDSEALSVTDKIVFATDVNAQNIVTITTQNNVGDYVLTNAVIVDTTGADEEIASISDINDAVTNTNGVEAFFVFNAKTMEVSYVYIVSQTSNLGS